MAEERSPGGSRIYRYDRPPEDPQYVPTGGGDTQEAVETHIETLGEIEFVYHELISPLVHLDVFSVGPSADRPFRTLVTCGMSEKPMTGAPEPELTRSELCLFLPEEWPVDSESWEDHRHFWPIELLKFLARFPHEYETWLWREHTLPNGDPPAPYDDSTALCGAMIVPPVVLPDAFAVLERPGEDDIHFFAVVPLHADEMTLKLRKGAGAVYDAFEAANTELVIDPDRPSAASAKRRKRFGLF